MKPTCRFCQSPLTTTFCDLGHQPPSNSLLTEEDLGKEEVYYPLKVYICNKCRLVQIPEIKKAGEIFGESYPYYSSESPANVRHAKEYVEMMVDRFKITVGSRWVEIGSNDGYLLQWAKEKHMNCWGVEPAEGPADKCILNHAIPVVKNFWGKLIANRFFPESADVITGINVLAHQPDILDFVKGIAIALSPTGICTMEFPHLMRTVEGYQFDQIYHEHYNYLSFTVVKDIFEACGLEMFDVEELPEHGGSLRVFAQKKGGPQIVSPRVREMVDVEKDNGVLSLEYGSALQSRANHIRDQFCTFLAETFRDNKIVMGYGAAAKGNTFLNYCRVTNDDLICVVDRSPYKQGKRLPGSHIMICEEDEIRRWEPDYVLILPWNLKGEIMEQLKYIREWGGKFVVAIPELEVI